MQWSDLFSAIALLLIFEGIMPFLKPEASRLAARKIELLSDRQLRIAGFVLMLAGLAILSIAR